MRLAGGHGRRTRGTSGTGHGFGPSLQRVGHAQGAPQSSQRPRQVRPGGPRLRGGRGAGQGAFEVQERGDDGGPQSAQVVPIGRAAGFGPGMAPDLALPTAFQGFVLEPVDRLLGDADQPGFQGPEPVLMPPIARGHAQGVTGQFGQRMVGDRFAPIQEEGDLVTRKHPPHGVVVTIQAARQHRAVRYRPPWRTWLRISRAASTTSSSDARRHHAERRLAGREFQRDGGGPMPFQMRQHRIVREASRQAVAAQHLVVHGGGGGASC